MNPSCPAQGAPRAPQGSGALRCSAVPQTRNGCHGYPEGCAQERRLPLKATICSQLLQACLRPYSNRGTWLLPQTSVCKPFPARTAFPVPTALSNNTACHFYLKTGVKIAPQKHCHLQESPKEGMEHCLPSAAHCVHLPFPAQHSAPLSLQHCKIKLKPEPAPPEK